MKQLLRTILVFAALGVPSNEALTQGISRSTGLGFKISFWNVTNQPSRVRVSGVGETAEFNISGAGASLYFFSRMYHNWFLEFNLGGIGAASGQASQFVAGDVEVSTLVPLLFGLRYDVLSSRLTSAMQPYLSAGIGPYWGTEIKVEGTTNPEASTIESSLNYGNYIGAGMNIMLSSWFALNFDFR